jgi:predicted transcriptional regulator
MSNSEKTITILRALASRPRLQVLECVQKGISHPNEIAKTLRRGRGTVEQHLQVLATAKIIEKVQFLDEHGQKVTQYNIPDKANKLLVALQELLTTF